MAAEDLAKQSFDLVSDDCFSDFLGDHDRKTGKIKRTPTEDEGEVLFTPTATFIQYP